MGVRDVVADPLIILIVLIVNLKAEEYLDREHTSKFRDHDQAIDIFFKLDTQVLSTLLVAIVKVEIWQYRHLVVCLQLEVGVLNDLMEGQKIFILLPCHHLCHSLRVLILNGWCVAILERGMA